MKKKRSAKRFLRQTGNAFSMMGFTKNPDDRLKEMGAKPPKVKKPFERVNQVSFKKEVNFYLIKVRTSANEEQGVFNETGKVQVLVVNPAARTGEQIVFYRYFRRNARKLAERVIKLVTSLDLELSARPSDTKGRFMNLEEISPRKTVWRSPQFKNNKEEKEMFLKLPSYLASFIKKEQGQWNYYQGTVRKKKKIKKLESDIRRKWDIENPENAVPVQ